MKCWVEGSKCLMHGDNNDFGLLNVVISFCKECFVKVYNEGIIEDIFRVVETESINEDDLFCLANNATVVFAALRFLERKYKEKISKIEKGEQKDTQKDIEVSWKIEENLQAISELKEVFKKLRIWYST